VLWNRNDLLQFRFRLWKSFGSGSGSGSRQYLAQFSKNKQIAQNLAFSMSETAFTFFITVHSMLDPDPNPVPEPHFHNTAAWEINGLIYLTVLLIR
jgi:hypothetical protein